MFIASRTDNCTFRTAASAVTNVFYTIAADTTVVTPAASSNTVFAQFAVCTNIFGTVIALFSAFFTDHGTLRTAFSAVAGIRTFTAEITIAAPSRIAYTADAVAAVRTDFSGTVFALFSTAWTNIGTAVTAAAAFTDDSTSSAGTTVITPYFIFNCTVFAQNATGGAKCCSFTIGTGFSTALTQSCTVGTAFPTVAYRRTGTTGSTAIAEIVIADTVRAFLAFIADPVSAFDTVCSAAFADYVAVFAASLTVLAHHDAALAQTTVLTEEIQTVGAVFSAVLTDFFRCTFAAQVTTAIADVVAFRTAAAAPVIALAALIINAQSAVLT